MTVSILGLFISFVTPYVALSLGARQSADYDFVAPAVSGLGFIFWMTIFILLLTQWKIIFRKHAFAISCLAFYLTTYFSLEVTARIFENSMLLVLLSGLSMIGYKLLIYKFLILFYGLFMWYFFSQNMFLSQI
jgi:hypothetical protein